MTDAMTDKDLVTASPAVDIDLAVNPLPGKIQLSNITRTTSGGRNARATAKPKRKRKIGKRNYVAKRKKKGKKK